MSYRMKDDTSMSDDSYPPSSGKFPSMIDLLRCHAWLGRFVTSGSDELLLQAPNECQAFIHAFHRLKHAHLQPFHCTTATAATMYSDTIANITVQAEKIKSNQEFNVLQSTLDDDIAFKILDYLTSQSLVQVSKTCNRLNVLCKTNAHLRSFDVALARQLTTPMQRLRAKEQIQGISNTINDCHVPIPSLLLRRRIVITDCGDPEYNGVYHCTGCNGNGYSFTKPRDSSIIQNLNKYERRQTLPSRLLLPDDSSVRAHDESFESDGDELQDTTHRETLRCMLAKRFSNETILWYMSKEVIATDHAASEIDGNGQAGKVIQVFHFWAKLMVLGDASPDVSRYPSQSSIMQRNGEGWESLTTTETIEPPIVELLD